MLEMFSLKERVALITGSSRGLGWAMAQALSGAGAHIVLNGRDAATLKPRVAELERAGGQRDGSSV
jgi:gluconate 5-dehydrogenase